MVRMIIPVVIGWLARTRFAAVGSLSPGRDMRRWYSATLRMGFRNNLSKSVRLPDPCQRAAMRGWSTLRIFWFPVFSSSRGTAAGRFQIRDGPQSERLRWLSISLLVSRRVAVYYGYQVMVADTRSGINRCSAYPLSGCCISPDALHGWLPTPDPASLLPIAAPTSCVDHSRTVTTISA
jgi:hypothetical protein